MSLLVSGKGFNCLRLWLSPQAVTLFALDLLNVFVSRSVTDIQQHIAGTLSNQPTNKLSQEVTLFVQHKDKEIPQYRQLPISLKNK